MKKCKALSRALKLVQHGIGYILVVPRGEREVVAVGTHSAPGRLIALNAARPLEEPPLVVETEHSQAILAQVGRRFSSDCKVDGFGLHCKLEPRALAAEVAEYDPSTGLRRPLLGAA